MSIPYIYRLKNDLVHDETGKEYVVYGIEAISTDEQILQSISDIFFDKQKAEHFVCLCNDGNLDLIHLLDVVEDVLGEQYTIF